AKGGNAQHHLVAQAVVQQGENIGCAVAFQMHKNGGDNLRVFVVNQFGNGGGFEQVQGVDAVVGRVLRFENVFNDTGCALAAQRLVQHRANVVFGTQRYGHELVGFLAEFFQHAVDV